MKETRVTIGTGGRINLPAAHRRALGFEEGAEVILAVEGDSLRISSRRAAIRRARELVGRYVPEDVSLVEELSAERREEARAESTAETDAETEGGNVKIG